MIASSTAQRTALITTIASVATAAVSLGYLVYTQRHQSEETEKKAEDADHVDITGSRGAAAANDDDVPVFEIQTSSQSNGQENQPKYRRILAPNTITIAHGSVTGTCSKLAQDLLNVLQDQTLFGSEVSGSSSSSSTTTTTIQMGPLDEWDWWDELLNYEEEEEEEGGNGITFDHSKSSSSSSSPVLLLLLPTHHAGSWPPTATCLETALQDLQNDWRIEKFPLRRTKLRVAVMGMGCSDYGNDSMGKPAREAFVTFKKVGAQVMGRQVRVGDDAIGNQDRVLQAWIHHDILPRLIVADDDDDDDEENGNSDKENAVKEPQVTDMEDMGAALETAGQGSDEDGGTVGMSSKPREMVTATQAKALKKEGYKLIGTHSAVKLCRWTKHQLRGRGGCYKHTFYGITSYQCMEATPSLACANKCVFCWRHHKNPVGKEWKWKTDDPHFIVEEAVKTHIQMINETKGIPGVNPQRWQEAHTVRHCALSLVGEPIMYPRINELLADLHTRHISSFLVTNGQHPKSISSLIPVTQLYVSVDAPTPESLVAIDRPLFSDAWDRLKESLSLLRDKGQRTVARLTVVKGWNSDEVEGYAKLIALGQVSLIEVKGVTFCGKSDASNLNMSNTPWHHEVIDLVRNLKLELDRMRLAGGADPPPEYDLACEHKHSVSVLLARVDQFAVDGPNGERTWKTWIDYPKFQELSARHVADPSFSFSVKDYIAETPAWALFGSEEEGFDPTDTRHRKKQKYPKYTAFDDQGIPTHDHNQEALSKEERQRLSIMRAEKVKQVGLGSTVTQLKGGEKLIQDASLMFRGQVIVK